MLFYRKALKVHVSQSNVNIDVRCDPTKNGNEWKDMKEFLKNKNSNYPRCNHHLNHHTTNIPHDFHHNNRNCITGKTTA